MNKRTIFSIIVIVIITTILLLLIIQCSISRFQLIHVDSSYQALEHIEPEEPINLSDPPFFTVSLPENEFPIKTVINSGSEIPVYFIYNNPSWKRQSYKKYWHSSYFRWSYVPNRIHYAMHRIFATYPTASVYYDFKHNLGIAEETLYFKKYVTSSTSPFTYLEVVIMNTSIHKIYTYENQVVIIGKPQRSGLQAIVIPANKIKPAGDNKEILIQLATLGGDEIDYTTIMYASDKENDL